ncbi:putative ankyrin repeat protein [Heterostelium album PN500]|uniref:Palmitoyltransferase n=1 Tax=Heterostelium pallidum (strain ATCC 26659 / Pp 5 / PN500) TaxID=670386 RepID=D3B8C9_HETP5|nr:putative ankyrin repeat protein [Heterostelium album PN500]EFA82297.1 putative ankyrin repeat protein [Heterostelium album PN500]|eukprot:XP_020434414.1 putative ankyrin repeat protein [Heterostelium album PN500]
MIPMQYNPPSGGLGGGFSDFDNKHASGSGGHGHSHGGNGGGHGHSHGGGGGNDHGHSHGGGGGNDHGHSHGGGHHHEEEEEKPHQHVFGGIPEVVPYLQIVTPSILESSPPMLREQYMLLLERYSTQQLKAAEHPWSGPLPYSTVLIAMEVAQQGNIKDYQGMIEKSGISTKSFLNMVDIAGNTALHYAVLKKQLVFVQYLLDNGASVDIENHTEGQTALHWACISTEPTIVHRLIDAGADPHKVDKRGYNSLLHASQYNQIHSIRLILECGVNLHSTDFAGHTALHWAAYQGHANLARFFVFKGIDINSIDDQGRTALHWACHKGHKAVVSMLCNLKADRFTTDKDANMCYDLAKSKGLQEIMDFLESKDQDEKFTSIKQYNYFWITAGCMTLLVPIVLLCTLPFVLAAPLIGIIGYFSFYTLTSKYWIPENNNPFNPTILYFSNVIWYILYIFVLAPATYSTNMVPHILINIQMWFFFVYFIKLVFMDAGAVSRYHSQESSTKEFMTALEQRKPLPLICPTCLINRPIRSKHCPSCNQCNARFDHHCIWINNCVAANNQSLFIALVFNYVTLVLSGFVITMNYFALDVNGPAWSDGRLDWIKYFYSNYTVTFFFLIYGPIVASWIGKLGLSQLLTIVFNKTTYEQIIERREMTNAHSHGHSHGGENKSFEANKDGQFSQTNINYNAYNRGKMNNVKEFLFDIKKYYYLMDLSNKVFQLSIS